MKCNNRLKWVKSIFSSFKRLNRVGVIQILSRRETLWLMRPYPKYFFLIWTSFLYCLPHILLSVILNVSLELLSKCSIQTWFGLVPYWVQKISLKVFPKFFVHILCKRPLKTLKHLLLFEKCKRKICGKFIYKHPETIEYAKN